MRARVATVMSLLLILFAIGAAIAPPVLAQDTETEQSEGGNTTEGEGQSEADAETGAGEGEQEGAATEEGPPWTYQMARIGIVLLVLVGLLMGLLYYRMIGSRQRGAA